MMFPAGYESLSAMRQDMLIEFDDDPAIQFVINQCVRRFHPKGVISVFANKGWLVMITRLKVEFNH